MQDDAIGHILQLQINKFYLRATIVTLHVFQSIGVKTFGT